MIEFTASRTYSSGQAKGRSSGAPCFGCRRKSNGLTICGPSKMYGSECHGWAGAGQREGLQPWSITSDSPGAGQGPAHSQARQTHQGSLGNSGNEDGEKRGKTSLCSLNRENRVFEMQLFSF